MIYGIGTDICDIRRIRAALERRGERFAETVLGDRASAAILWAVVRAESLAEGVGIVLSSPEFNRR